MAVFEENDRPRPKAELVGADLSTLSEHELEERIGLLRAEIERIEATLKTKRAGRDAAASFFKD